VRDICPDKSESPAISQDGWDVITERLIELARRQPELRFDPPYCVKQRASGRGWWSGLSRKDDFETRRSSRLKAVAFARRGVRRQSLSRSRGDKSSQFWNQPAAKLSVWSEEFLPGISDGGLYHLHDPVRSVMVRTMLPLCAVNFAAIPVA